MKRLTATVGLPGAGKSSWAMNRLLDTHRHGIPYSVVRLNGDQLRIMMHGGVLPESAAGQQVLAVKRAAIRACFDASAREVIIDALNLDPSVLYQWYALAWSLGAEFAVRSFLDVPLEICVDRDDMRLSGTRAGRRRIESLHERWFEAASAAVALVEAGANPFVPLIQEIS